LYHYRHSQGISQDSYHQITIFININMKIIDFFKNFWFEFSFLDLSFFFLRDFLPCFPFMSSSFSKVMLSFKTISHILRVCFFFSLIFLFFFVLVIRFLPLLFFYEAVLLLLQRFGGKRSYGRTQERFSHQRIKLLDFETVIILIWDC